MDRPFLAFACRPEAKRFLKKLKIYKLRVVNYS
jgi:hypothetical protein